MSNHDFKDDVYDERMGLMTSYRWRHDPKTVLFMLSRYKFVAKMLDGYGDVLEIGCGDALGSHLVANVIGHLKCIDIDCQMLLSANRHPKITYECNSDIRHSSGSSKWDAVYALDVIEHMEKKDSMNWVRGISQVSDLSIIGMPSLESQEYASPLSKANHINCMSAPDLKSLMKEHFKHVFMFSMNDEVVHTGFHKLAHYIFAIGVN